MKRTFRWWMECAVALIVVAFATGAPGHAQDDDCGSSVIVYTLPDHTVWRVTACEGATPENISAALDTLAEGTEDGPINVSPDGAWLLIETDRFDSACAGWSCLALVAADLSSGDVVRIGDDVLHPEDYFAVAPGGSVVVYSEEGQSHTLDLWAITRTDGGAWSEPTLLTADSPYAWNHQPAFHPDGDRIVFDCGNEPYGAENTAICEVRIDSSAFRVIWSPDQAPTGTEPGGALHHADYTPTGGIVFEGDWGGEAIWHLEPDAPEPERVTEAFSNDNSPCVLPDGRIVSLWLNRSGGEGYHEIKVMAPDGSDDIMILIDQDVFDVGLGCGAAVMPPSAEAVTQR
jgi:hypothetical protein